MLCEHIRPNIAIAVLRLPRAGLWGGECVEAACGALVLQPASPLPSQACRAISYRHGTALGNVLFRLEILSQLMSTTSALALPLHGAAFAWRHGLLTLAALKAQFLALAVMKGWLFCILVNKLLWRHRPELQVSFKTVMLMPLYQIFLALAMIVGHWRCVLYYIPFFPMRHGLYSEGLMTKKLLKAYHNIDVEDDSKDENDARPLLVSDVHTYYRTRRPPIWDHLYPRAAADPTSRLDAGAATFGKGRNRCPGSPKCS